MNAVPENVDAGLFVLGHVDYQGDGGSFSEFVRMSVVLTVRQVKMPV
jgi:hypothetical protein